MSQLLVLPTEPRFLRFYQTYTRETLLGVIWRQGLCIRDPKSQKQLQPLGLLVQSVLAQLQSSVARAKSGTWLTKRLRTSKVVVFFLVVVVLVGLLLSGLVFAPAVYYSLRPADEVVVPPEQPASVLGGEFKQGASSQLRETYQPPYDASLPDGDWLIIEQIGVRTPLRATEDPSQAIAKGVWMAPDYGRPGDSSKPIILAAHRFGYKWWWQNDYWKKNSFYRLPETKAGTIVKIISNHRQWEYEIYKAEEGDEITDYDADLILYTCKFLNSPVRHVRYARLINPDVDTQNQPSSSLKESERTDL